MKHLVIKSFADCTTGFNMGKLSQTISRDGLLKKFSSPHHASPIRCSL